MIKSIKKNYLIYFFFLIYFFIGSYLSLTSGISSDEYHEQKNWLVNLTAAKQFIQTGDYNELINYWDKYHGIAFQFISQPIQYLIKDFVTDLNYVSNYGGLLLSKHFVVFSIFCLSGVFFYLITFKITAKIYVSLFSTSIYLLYPYLFGHAHFNPKDIPFLSFWLINTYFSLRIIEDLYLKKKIEINKLILISILTAFLISIRIIGLLILVQYIIAIIIYLEKSQNSFLEFIKKNSSNLLIIIFSLSVFIYLFNPIFWHNPIEIVNSIKWMGKYPQNICTLTNGTCFYSFNLPSSYIFIWLFYKLPILVLLGYCLFPLVESKIFKDNVVTIYYGTITITPPVIIVLFVLKDVALYDELRHLLFIFPLIFLTSLTNLYYLFNKKIFYSLSSLVIIFFISENFFLNPYQYTWLNSFAKLKKIDKNFEIDYWGLSNKSLQQKIIQFADKENIPKSICIYGDFYVKEFLLPHNFSCFKTYTQVDAAKNRPFIAYKNLRNVKRSDPKDCTLIWNEVYQYTFYKKDISVGTLWYCD